MIALILAAIFGVSPPCYATPARREPISNVYFLSGDFLARNDGARLWSSQPISATVVYSDTTDVATLSLRDSLALRNQDGTLATQSNTAYTIYLCTAETRPGAVWIPLI